MDQKPIFQLKIPHAEPNKLINKQIIRNPKFDNKENLKFLLLTVSSREFWLIGREIQKEKTWNQSYLIKKLLPQKKKAGKENQWWENFSLCEFEKIAETEYL